jgi:hypothetical protein
MRCLFCGEDVEASALVCRTCGRDLAVPEHLQREHDELLRMRNALQAELDRAMTELERYRRLPFQRRRRSS